MKQHTATAAFAVAAFVAGGTAAVGTGAIGRRPYPLAQVAKPAQNAAKSGTVSATGAKRPSQPREASNAAAAQSSGPAVGGDEGRFRGVKLGTNSSLGTWRPFPDDNYWNTPIDHLTVDDNSRVYLSSIGLDKHLHPDFGPQFEGRFIGIPFVVVNGTTPRHPVTFQYADESDHELYPIPANPPIEGYPDPPEMGDRHLLMIDRDNWRLFELIGVQKQGKRWAAISGAVFDLNTHPNRPNGWTSADAAGLPIFPALVKWEEVHIHKEIRHALRFTVPKTQRAYVPPASHYASPHKDPTLPPMGIRVRLKASYDISGFSPQCQVILKALKKYGMILADNGSPFFIQGSPDPRWESDKLAEIKRVKGADLEVVQTSYMVR